MSDEKPWEPPAPGEKIQVNKHRRVPGDLLADPKPVYETLVAIMSRPNQNQVNGWLIRCRNERDIEMTHWFDADGSIHQLNV